MTLINHLCFVCIASDVEQSLSLSRTRSIIGQNLGSLLHEPKESLQRTGDGLMVLVYPFYQQ